MRKIVLIWIVSLLIVGVIFIALSSRSQGPKRFSNLPAKAVWIGGTDGGAWFQVEKVLSGRAFRIKIFNDENGSLLTDSTFTLNAGCAITKIESADLMKAINGYDGNKILLAIPEKGNKCYLKPQ
jgi:hypothetical protein